MQENEIIEIDNETLKDKIYTVRGVKVMLDSSLAEIYGYSVKAFNQQVKNNIEKFDEDFRFQLTKDEYDIILRSNFLTLEQGKYSKYLPYAFTEQGVYMLMTVLKGDLATKQSKALIRLFKEMKHFIQENNQFVTKTEMQLLTTSVSVLTEQTKNLEKNQKSTTEEIEKIYESIEKINENFVLQKDLKEFVIYKGQKFEADLAYSDIYKLANKTIYVIDDYVNIKTLDLLKQKKKNVKVILFTENKRGSNGVLTSSEVTDFNSQYPTITIKPNPDCHDRFIILDYKTDKEKVFHCGPSSKDAGNKVCAINKFENTFLIYPVVEKYLLQKDIII